jgi:hypothetical protein
LKKVKFSSKITMESSKKNGILEYQLLEKINEFPDELILISHSARHEKLVLDTFFNYWGNKNLKIAPDDKIQLLKEKYRN